MRGRGAVSWNHNCAAVPIRVREASPQPAQRQPLAKQRPPLKQVSESSRQAAPAIAAPVFAESAALLAAALSQLSEGVIVADATGRITFVNEAAARLHGVARLDVTPQEYASTYSLFTEQGEPYPSTELPLARASLRGETVENARWCIRRADGTEVIAVGTARPVLDGGGKQVGAVLTVRDDTARSVAERARAESEERLHGAFEQSPVSTVRYDATGHVVAINPAFERLWGGGIAQVPPGYTVLEDPQLEQAGVLSLIRRAFQGEVITTPPVRYDMSIAAGEAGHGRVLLTQAHLYPVRNAAGEVVEVVLTHEDVTARVVAEDELKATAEELRKRTGEAERARERMSLLADASAALVASLDLESTLRAVARVPVPAFASWCMVFVTDGERGLRPVATHCAIDTKRDAVVRMSRRIATLSASERHPVQDANATGQPQLVLEAGDDFLRSVTRDAEFRALFAELEPTSLLAAPMIVHGRTVGVVLFVTDRTGRSFVDDDVPFAEELARRAAAAVDNARLYESERTARAAAESASRAKSEFLSTMSHELRTPLNAIGGYAELMAMGVRGPVTDAQREDLARIRGSGQYLLVLINDILNYTRLDAGRVEYQIRDVAIGELVIDLETLLVPQLHEKTLQFTQQACDAGVSVRADRERLRQILINLLVNAVKFTDAGGRIVLACSATDAEARIAISDTGRGIPADQLERIFEPFVQVDRQLTRASQQGVGLGLAISRELARGMGGELVAESTVGKGSVFTVTLPRGSGIG